MKKGGKLRQYLSVLLIFAMVLTMSPVSVFADTSVSGPSGASGTTDAYGVDTEWYNFRNNPENNGITNAPTPTSPDTTSLKWAVKYGTGWAAAPTPPLVLDGKLYIGVANKVYELDKETGQKLRESDTMIGNVGYAMNPITYADGKLFVLVGNGIVQAIDFKTLKCSWYTPKIGGQTLCPISHNTINGKGYIYTGTWAAESKDGSYYCVSTDDNDLTTVEGSTNGGGKIKALKWRFTPATKITDETAPGTAQTYDEELAAIENVSKRGFYWAGAYANEKFVAVGTDDGDKEGTYTNGAAFYTLNPETGKVIDKVGGIKGDVRSTTVYDNGYLYFSTKGGVLYKVKVSADGKLSDESHIDIAPASGMKSAMATASPLVYKNKIYMGVAGDGGQFSPDGGHSFKVIDNSGALNQDSIMYSMPIPGYPQAAALASTAYVNEDFDKDGKADGRVYIYFTYNYMPGGIYYCYDTADQTETKKEQSGEIFIPSKDKQQYCISTICADREGTLYYKNESCFLMAVETNCAKINTVSILGENGEELSWADETGSTCTFNPKTAAYEVTYPVENKNATIELGLDAGTTATIDGVEYTGKTTIETPKDAKAMKLVAKTTIGGKDYERTYNITLRAKKDESNLSSVKVGTSNAFSSFVTLSNDANEYYADASSSQSFWRLWLRKADTNATIDVTAGENCSKIVFAAGTSVTDGHDRWNVYKVDNAKNTSVNIKVTAEDGKTVSTYKVNFYSAADKSAAAAVVNGINAIGPVTVASKAKIEAARAAYDKLTDLQKALVTNYETLVAAEEAYPNVVIEALKKTNVNVYVAAQMGTDFLAPVDAITVNAYLAESYGYKDKVTTGVSALDVLVAEHQAVFGEEFTKETANDYLVVSDAGWINLMFGSPASASGFAINDKYPKNSSGVGYLVNEAPVNKNDRVAFFFYQDTSYWTDALSSISVENASNLLTLENIKVKVEGFMYMMGYETDENLKKFINPIEDAQIALVNTATGEKTPIKGAVTDENGYATVKFDKAGTYTLTAYTDFENDDTLTPVIMSLKTITVNENKNDEKALAAIEALPTEVTLADKEAVVAARAAYEAVPAELKANVNNYSKLVIAEKDIKILETQAELDKTKDELNKANSSLAELQTKYDALKAESDATKAQLAEANSKLADLQTKYDALKKDSDANKALLEATKAELEAAKAEVEATKAQLTVANAQIETLKGTIDATKAELEAAKKELASTKADNEATKAELEKAKAEIKEAQDKLAATATELDTTKKELEVAKSQLELTQAELEAAKKDIENSKAEMAQIKAEIEDLKASLEEAMLELAKANAKEKTVSGLKLTSKSKKITASWKATEGVRGYQVVYKTKSAKTYKTLIHTTKLSAVTKTLKKGTTYQFKVRTYTTIDGQKVYGQWSSVKSIKCK